MDQSQQTQPILPCFKVRSQPSLFSKFKGLFDFHHPDLFKRRYWEVKVSSRSKIYRDEKHNQTYYTVGEFKLDQNYACIGQLDCQNYPQNPRYWFRVNLQNQIQNQHKKTTPYLVLDSKWNNRKYKGERLNAGDIFRLGTVNFAVIDIVNTQKETKPDAKSPSLLKELGEVYKIRKLSQEQKKLSLDSNPGKHKKIKKQPKTPQKAKETQHEQPLSCKICLSQEQTETDPLISPCRCRGSCRLIHLECLKTWVASKIRIQRNYGIQIYHIKITSCQICKQTYPRAFDFGNKVVDLLTLQTNKTHYIVLQQFRHEYKRQDKIVYIIVPARLRKIFSIGRGGQNNIRINNSALSRRHAQIQFIQDHFYLRDCHSRFGSVIKLQKDYEFFSHSFLKVLVGRCVYEVKPTLSSNPLNTYSDDEDDMQDQSQ